MRKIRRETVFGRYFIILPVLIIAACGLFLLIYHDRISLDTILSYTPENKLLAALLFILAFALKGISVMFPGTIIYVAAGLIFPAWLAAIVVILGTAAEIIVTYYMGYLCGEMRLIKKLQEKPKFKALFEKGQKNENILVYLSRILGLPYDVMGMFWGSVGARFLPYVFFSMLGKFPKVVIETFAGYTVGTKLSTGKIVVFALLVLATVLVTVVSNKLLNKREAEKAAPLTERD